MSQKCFFIDGIAGTGKTFVYQALIYELIQAGFNVGVCATTGTASSLLPDGQTMHKMVGIPIRESPEDNKGYEIDPNSE